MKNFLCIFFCLITISLFSQKRIENIERPSSVTSTLTMKSSTSTTIYYRTVIKVKEDTAQCLYFFIVAKSGNSIIGVWLAYEKNKAMAFSYTLNNGNDIFVYENEFVAVSNSGRSMSFIQKTDSVFLPSKLHKQVHDKFITEKYIFK